MKYLVNHFLALIMQLKVNVTSKGQGHVHFTTEQDTLLHWYYVQWMHGHILLLMAQYIVSYGGKGDKNI